MLSHSLAQTSVVAKLGLLVGLAPLVLGMLYAIRPSERRLALMRPISLAAIFAALCTMIVGMVGAITSLAASPDLALYRFAIEDLYRQQEHVLDEKGEHLLSLSSRFSSTPYDAYAALSTADVKHPAIKLPTSGAEVTLTYGQYRAILATNRNQCDRAAAFTEYHKLFEATSNTYSSLYNGVLTRDWFHAEARRQEEP